MKLLADRLEDGEVDQLAEAFRQIGRLRLLRPRLHEGAAPDLARDEAAADQLVIGAADGLHGELEVVGELAMRQKACTVRQQSFLDGAGDLFSKGKIGRPAQLGYIGSPICHDFNSAQIQFN